jgi:CheY-like chemotaxis protein
MPEEDGYSFIRKIRALDPNNGGKIPALALTAYAGQDDIKRVMFSGFQAHLAKPVDGHRLAEVIAQLAGRT